MKKYILLAITVVLLMGLSGCMANYYTTGDKAPKTVQDGKLTEKRKHVYLIGNRLNRENLKVPDNALIKTNRNGWDMLWNYLSLGLIQTRTTKIYTK